jgi:hypothetical protein
MLCQKTPGSSCQKQTRRFSHCSQAQEAWFFAFTILSSMAHRRATLPMFSFQHALFGQQLPRAYHALGSIWAYVRSVTMWSVWIARNDVVFNHLTWAQKVPSRQGLLTMAEQPGVKSSDENSNLKRPALRLSSTLTRFGLPTRTSARGRRTRFSGTISISTQASLVGGRG